MRPWQLYLAAAISLALAFTGVAYLSATALTQDRERTEARQRALLEESTRLALWRMDSDLSTVLAAENARPYFDYGAFYAIDRTYATMMVRADEKAELVPSSLLLAAPEGVLLHFQFDPLGNLSSPQVPTGAFLQRAEEWTNPGRLEESKGRLENLKRRLQPQVIDDLRASSEAKQQVDDPLASNDNAQAEVMRAGSGAVQAVKSTIEFAQRSKSVRNASSYSNQVWEEADKNSKQLAKPRSMPVVPESAMAPIWFETDLFLVRRVRVGEERLLQGVWLDWPRLQKRLVTGVSDVLPQARLRPATAQDRASGRMLASLPVVLEPGVPLSTVDDIDFGIWPSLVLGWIGVLIAAFAVIGLLFGAVSLGERRAVFVSAVTHELRTPLTTFRMYADMLADGMITDPEKSKRYLDTLRREAVRLSHLVENVLAYARIERGRASAPPETLAVGALIERLGPRLADRAIQAEMTLVTELEAADAKVHVDTSAIEQILFNLVDNASKYAASATDRRIHLGARVEGKKVIVSLADHGPGITKQDRKGLFSAFSKSAQRAALSAPGVGLGLALSRRLARAMGGELVYAGSDAGARFELTLPTT